jgi:hypothetical protein
LLYDDSTSAALIQVPPYCVRKDLWPALLRYKSQVLHSRTHTHTLSPCYVCCACGIINTQTRARPAALNNEADQAIVFASSPFVPRPRRQINQPMRCTSKSNSLFHIDSAVLSFKRVIGGCVRFITSKVESPTFDNQHQQKSIYLCHF